MRVLIVEDDQRLVSYLKKSLEAEGSRLTWPLTVTSRLTRRSRSRTT